MDIQKKKQLQEKIYKLPRGTLKKIVETILKSNPNIKYTKNLNGYFFNMSFIEDDILLTIYDLCLQQEKLVEVKYSSS
jgi:hypothetical protein